MPEKKKFKKKFFLEDFFFADRPTRFFDRPATRNKLIPKVAHRGNDMVAIITSWSISEKNPLHAT